MKLSYNDRQHAYWLNGKRCKGVTTVAKYPDDTYNLEKWNKRMVALGMALNTPLTQRVKAHFDEKDKLDDIAEEALVAAKAHEASGRGTAVHRETERVDLGLDWIDTPESRAIRQAWTTALGHAGLEVVPDYVERIVVYPDQLVAGRFDRLCRRTTDGALVVVDVKTGPNAIRYPHSTVTQLAMYANAPLMAGPLERRGNNEITETFAPMPDGLDTTSGYVVYLPTEGPGQVHQLDLAAGWDTVTRICFPTIRWRKTTGLVTEIPAVGSPTAGETATTGETVVAATGRADATHQPVASADRILWLRARVMALKDAGHIADVAAAWPTDTPTLKQGGLTDPHIDQIITVLDRLEAEHSIPFGTVDPLYAGFATADIPPAPPAPAPDRVDPKADAGGWTDATKTVLAQFDEPEATAVALLVNPRKTDTTEQHHTWAQALAVELADPNGAVIFTYSTLGVDIVATDAADRIKRATKTQVEALTRAKRLAPLLERPTPRTFSHVCADPVLAALVAQGLGRPEHIANTTPQGDKNA